MYNIFYKYYRDYEEEYSIFDYNILSLVSGVQIIRFRKYYIDLYGKEEFLLNYKDFDVIYKEYLITGTIIFIIAFLINFSFVLYLQKIYKLHRIENPEIKNYTLILSGKDVPFVKYEEMENDENNEINDKKTAIKNQLLNELNVRDADINFTLKLSEYYKKTSYILCSDLFLYGQYENFIKQHNLKHVYLLYGNEQQVVKIYRNKLLTELLGTEVD